MSVTFFVMSSCAGNTHSVHPSKLDSYPDFEFLDFKFNFTITECFFCYKLLHEIPVTTEGRIKIGKELSPSSGGHSPQRQFQ